MNVTIREAQVADQESILAVLYAAFQVPVNSIQQQQRQELLHQLQPEGPRLWRVLEVEGTVAGALCVTRSRLQVGAGWLVKGDVGEVSILPEWQGRGLGSALMIDTVAWLRDHDYDFSRLGGLLQFYSRFGYTPFPRRYIEFALRPTVGAGVATFKPAYLEKVEDAHILPLTTPEEWQQCQALWTACHGGRTGELLDRPGAGDAYPTSGIHLLYRDAGEILAYLRGAEYAIDRTEFESRLSITGAAYAPGKAAALAALIRHILYSAYSQGHDHVSARLPFDPTLFAALTAANIPYKAVELHEAVAGNLIQVLNLHSFFAHLLPELKNRWLAAQPQPPNALSITCADQTVTLALDAQGVSIVPEPHTMPLAVPQATLLALALGLRGPSYLLSTVEPRPTLKLQYLFAILFPEQQVAAGNWC